MRLLGVAFDFTVWLILNLLFALLQQEFFLMAKWNKED